MRGQHALLVLLCSALCSALRIDLASVRTHRASSVASQASKASLSSVASQASKAALMTALCSASLLGTPAPALAVPTLNEAIVEVSESSYPILKALSPEAFPKFAEKLGGLFLEIRPEKLGKSLELAIDVLDSVPPDQLTTFNTVLKEAFSDLKPDSCSLVPLPPASLADKFGAVASEQVDAAKLKEFSKTWGPSLKALSRTDTAICLPSVETLDKLALAQAEVGRSLSAEEAAKFGSFTTPVLKSSFTLGKLLPLLDAAKTVAPSATPAEKAAFQAAGKRIEAASNAEAQKQKLAILKAKSAAKEAERATATPADPAAMAAAREAAVKAAAEKKAAALAEEEGRRAALKQAEADRIAALKAKSAAIAAAKK